MELALFSYQRRPLEKKIPQRCQAGIQLVFIQDSTVRKICFFKLHYNNNKKWVFPKSPSFFLEIETIQRLDPSQTSSEWAGSLVF